MKSHTLTTEILFSNYYFSICFESESMEENQLMNVNYHGELFTLPVDIPELFQSKDKQQSELYKAIMQGMKETAEAFWKDQRERKFFNLPNMVECAKKLFKTA